MNLFFTWTCYAAAFILSVSVAFCFVRIFIGPTLSDRIVGLDLTAYQLISLICIYSLIAEKSVYIDVVIALALIVFLGTVAFAQYIEWKKYKK